MQNNPWNKKTLLVLVGMLLLLVAIIALSFVESIAENSIRTYGMIAAAIIIIAIGSVYVYSIAKGKIGQTSSDYRMFFYMGIIFLPIGISNPPFLILSLAFITIGLANKNKWKPEQKWSEMPPTQRNLKIGLIILLGFLLIASFVVWYLGSQNKNQDSETPYTGQVTNFEECVAAGNAVMESYPRLCRQDGQTFTENIGNELEKKDLIRINSPRPNQVIQSPLVITGEARGFWFFEASFSVVLTDWNGLIIAEGIATAKSDWMTTGFVPFEATLTFTVDKNMYSNNGLLILKKDNPSGLPQNNDALEIPIVFAGVTAPSKACTQEAKLCPDGSYVSRTGLNCQFAPCPNPNKTGGGGTGIAPFKSGVMGKVLLGPTCPVIQNPPDPECADKGYATTVQVIEKDSPKSSLFSRVETDKDGNYKVMLPPGEYQLQALGGQPFPTCGWKDITISPDTMAEVNLSCDTGIR